MPKTIIGIIGGHLHNTSPQAVPFAAAVGAELGRRGLAIVCGGENGIMEASCRGCQEAGGITFGVLKGNRPEAANPFIDYAIATSLDVASNNVIVWTAAGLIAFDGRYGTLNEMALALDFGKPLVTTGSQDLLNVQRVESPYFSHFPGYEQQFIPQIVDHLMTLIERKRHESS